MPKPAKNVNQIVYGLGYTTNHEFRYGSWKPKTHASANGALYRYAEQHPATQNGTRIDGFTKPLPWSHSGFHYPAGCSGHLYVREPTRSGFIDKDMDANYVCGQVANQRQPIWSPTEASNVRSIAEIKALQRLKDQNVNIAVFFAEAGKASNQIANVLHQILDLTRSLRRNLGRDWWNSWRLGDLTSQRAAREILGWQYGIRPLMRDVCGIIDQFGENNRTRPRVFVIGKATSSFVTEQKCSGQTTSYTTYGDFFIPTQHTVRGKVRLDYEMDAPDQITASQLGLTDALELMYQLVPYSFVADWIVPVSTWLSSLTAARGWKFISGSCSIEEKQFQRKTKLRLRYKRGGPLKERNSVYCSSMDAYRFNRTVYTSSPIPGLPIKNPVSAEHALNALALIRVLFSDDRRFW